MTLDQQKGRRLSVKREKRGKTWKIAFEGDRGPSIPGNFLSRKRACAQPEKRKGGG